MMWAIGIVTLTLVAGLALIAAAVLVAKRDGGDEWWM